jgi:hypothetical protein
LAGEEAAAGFEPHFRAGEEVHFLVLVLREQVVEQLLAFRREGGGVGAELGPHLAVELRGARQAANAAGLLDRIEGGEVAKLHRQAARRAAHPPGHVHDQRIALVELSEGELAIKVQRDQEMLARPLHAGCFCHERNLSDQALS